MSIGNAATPPAAQTGGERELLDAFERAIYRNGRIAGMDSLSAYHEEDTVDEDTPRAALLAALDRGAAAEQTVAGLVEHKAVILNALLTLHPRNEAHRVRLDAAERAVSALPESAAREERVRCDECRKDDWRYDDPGLLPACPHPVASPAGAAAQTVAGETMTMICYACARPMAPAPDARDAVVEAARDVLREMDHCHADACQYWHDPDACNCPLSTLRTALAALTPTGGARD